MARAHYWLLLQIAKTPKAFTCGAGLLIAALLIAATITTVFLVDKTHTAQQHDRAASLTQDLITESTDLLNQLTRQNNTSCDSPNLIRLNALLLRARFVREVGILDADSQLICTTTMGRLPVPIKGNHPVIKTPSGKDILVDVPLQVADKAVTASIIRQGNFNVVLGPHVTEELFSSADYVWLRAVDGLALIKSASTPPSYLTQHIRAYADATHQNTWLLHSLGYTLLTVQPDTGLLLQTRRNWTSVIEQNSWLLTGMLAGSLMLALLVAIALAPRVMQLRGVQKRVQFLCDEQHIRLVYQPIFDLSSNQAVGCEVLMRLHEGQQVWAPDQVIPAILKAGLTHRYDHIIARKAIRELAQHLPIQNSGFKVTLNFFPESIDSTSLIPVLQDALQSAARNDLQLCIEVTEHSLSSKLITETNRLKAQGFLIAIDDFGTGYSNLQSVTTLSPDLLKIDKSFVFELEDTTLRSTLIPEIVNIARAVGAQIIAEGIEKLEQVPRLAAMGVQYGQGYALARPMDMKTFIAFMNRPDQGANA